MSLVHAVIPPRAASKMIWREGAAPPGRKRTLPRRKTPIQPCFKGVHMCMYRGVSVCMCMYVYVCVCIIDISLQYLYVLYAMAQNSTQAVTASSNDPLLGRESAGPTQGDPGQVPDHFTPPSGTHPRTRFGARKRAARVGGGQSESLVPPIGLP